MEWESDQARIILNVDLGHNCAMRLYIGILKRCIVFVCIETSYLKAVFVFETLFSIHLLFKSTSNFKNKRDR